MRSFSPLRRGLGQVGQRPGRQPRVPSRCRPVRRRPRRPPPPPPVPATAPPPPHGRDPIEVADGILRQCAAPAVHVGVGRDGRGRCRGRPRGRRGRSPTSSASSRWSTATSPARPTEVRSRTRSGSRSSTHCHFAALKVAALIVDGLDRRHEEARPRRERLHHGARQGQRDDGHRRVLDPGQDGRRRRRHRIEQARRRGSRGGDDHRVGLDEHGVTGGPHGQGPPGRRPVQLAHRGAGAHLDAAPTQPVGEVGGHRPRPPR